MTDLVVPTIDAKKYQWQAKSPYLYRRPFLGRESHWFHSKPESRELFLGVQAKLDPQVEHDSFVRVAGQAWLRLRFDHPEVALHAVPSANGKGMMGCPISCDDQEAKRWQQRTLSRRHGPNAYDFSYAISPTAQWEYQQRKAVGSTTLIVYAQCSPPEMKVTSISFLFRVDHTYADGIGIRLIAKAYLKIFAQYLRENPDNPMPPWQHASRNLSPPWVELMNEQQKTNGEDFEHNVRNDIDALLNHTQNSTSGFKVLPNVSDQFNPNYLISSFTKQQSAALLRMIKSKFGPTCTITSIAHAAFVLAMLKIHPPSNNASSIVTDSPSPFISPLFMNGRRYLDPDHPQTEDYTPICQANALITFPDINDLLLTPSTPPSQQIHMLEQACRASVISYSRLRERPSIFSESLAKAELIPKHQPRKDPRLVDPYFLSDGVQDKYISRTYDVSPHGKTERMVMEIEDVRFHANPDGKTMIIRMSSWRDIISIQAEWNEALYPPALAETFVDEIMGLMLMLL
ncbi:MAG: hypothetical protein L6R42_010439 [Xanthoria sp. 1 TBL-2021]|nr:MAG: hypothetical protein L6R42_010439 [Xanthoria sp. 1 TBL-2021]